MKRLVYLVLPAIFLCSLAFKIGAWTDDGQFHLECLHDGEVMKRLECHSTLCWVCQKNGYTYPNYRCAGMTPQCKDPGPGGYDMEPPVIDIVRPSEGQVLGSRRVLMEIETDEQAQYSYADITDQKGVEKRLCSRCTFYSRTISFNDGFHNITVFAQDLNYNKANKTVSFFIDSKRPRIRSNLPRKGSYTDGKFTVFYDEKNLEQVLLKWRGAGEWNTVEGICQSGDRQSCTIEVPGLPQGKIEYYFMLRDRVNNETSRITEVLVDTLSPQIAVIQPQPGSYSERKVQFQLNATEPATFEYIDLEDARPRFRRLCRDCTSYGRSQGFSDGMHRLVIKAADNAGNSMNTTAEFFVDSKAPRIIRMYPMDKMHANSTFTLVVMDDTLQRVVLNYKENKSVDYVAVSKEAGDCSIDGRYMICNFDVWPLEQGPLNYYFEAIDKATTVQSVVYDVTVDTVAPQIKVHAPKEQGYPDRYVLLNITTDEKATIGYTEGLGSRFMTLCTRCTSYERQRAFGYGEHVITFEATDQAKNKGSKTVDFAVGVP
ncbi:MAG: hypothetical protein ABIF10_02290 [Candidatus Woesearchaeota archaeon]